MIQKFRMSMIRFMRGRYGDDALNRFLMGSLFAMFILSLFFSKWDVLRYLYFIFFVAYEFRFLSKNITQRRKENTKFLSLIKPFRSRFIVLKKNLKDRNHKVFICPQCNGKVRIPKGHGMVAITCPYCRHEFTKRS
jgi:hypothetical protein